MGFYIEVFADEPIVMSHLDETFTIADDLPELLTQVVQILDAVSQPVFYVAHMDKIKMTFDDLVSGASTAARGADTFMHHPNIRETLLITSDKMVLFSLQGLRSPVFGINNVRAFPTVDEGLAYAHQQIVSA